MIARILNPVHNFCLKKNYEHKVIWHFCTPKSASTYLTVLLNDLILDFRPEKLRDRVDPNANYISEKHQQYAPMQVFQSHFLSKKNVSYFGHSHTHFSDYLDFKILSPNHKIICQTRSILDTIISFYEHLNKYLLEFKRVNGVTAIIKCRVEEWKSLTEEEKLDLVIYYYVPWHVDWLVSWLINNTKYNLHLVQYEAFMQNQEEGIRKMLEFCGFETSMDKIENAINRLSNVKNEKIRKNVGKVGRGQKILSNKQYSKVKEILSVRANYFQTATGLDLYSFL